MRRGQGKLVRRLSLASVVAALSLAASASPAGAVTIGQLSPLSPADTTCNGGPFDTVQPTVTGGNSYVVPSTGGVTSWKVTSWSHNASVDAGQSLTMKFWRPLGGVAYLAVGHDGPRSMTPSQVNTFSGLSIPVKSGDVLGISPNGLGGNNGCGFDVVGDQWSVASGSNLADGQSGPFGGTRPENRLNVKAVITPTNTYAIAGITRNKKKGTATITANVPNPGDFSGSGQGAQVASTAAVTSKAVPAGTATLVVKAKGKKKRKLNEKGKVKLNLAVTYTPTGGDPSTQSVKVKLKKRL